MGFWSRLSPCRGKCQATGPFQRLSTTFAYILRSDQLISALSQLFGGYISGGGGRGRGNFGTDVRPDIPKPTPFIYLGSENWDRFIYMYLPFKITTYTCASMGYGIHVASRKDQSAYLYSFSVRKTLKFTYKDNFNEKEQSKGYRHASAT